MTVEDAPLLTRLIAEQLPLWRARAHATQDELTRIGVAFGFDWTRNVVAAIEAGDRDLRADEMMLIGHVLGALMGAQPLAPWQLTSAPVVRIGGVAVETRHVSLGIGLPSSRADATVPSGVRSCLNIAGHPVVTVPHGYSIDPGSVRTVNLDEPDNAQLFRTGQIVLAVGRERSIDVDGSAERRAAERFDIEAADFSLLAHSLWGRSLSRERDARVAALGPLDPSQRRAIRGRVTRDLYAELGARTFTTFLGLAGQISRLASTDPATSAYDPVALTRFQSLHAREMRQVIAWRNELVHAGTPIDLETDLSEKVAVARRLLDTWNDPPRRGRGTPRPESGDTTGQNRTPHTSDGSVAPAATALDSSAASAN